MSANFDKNVNVWNFLKSAFSPSFKDFDLPGF